MATTTTTTTTTHSNPFNNVPILDSLFDGFIGLLIGFSNAITSSKIRSSYISFLAWFVIITTLAYAIVSTTMIGLMLLLFLILLGPIFGPIVFISSFLTFMSILILMKLIFIP